MKEWLKKLFSDSGEVSFGRVAAFIALIASISWINIIVITKHEIPPLGGVVMFICAMYGVSKLSETIVKIKEQ